MIINWLLIIHRGIIFQCFLKITTEVVTGLFIFLHFTLLKLFSGSCGICGMGVRS